MNSNLQVYPISRLLQRFHSLQLLSITSIVWKLRKLDLLINEQLSHHYLEELLQMTESLSIDPDSELGQISASLRQLDRESLEATRQLLDSLY